MMPLAEAIEVEKLLTWRYSPGRIDGKPVPVRIEVAVSHDPRMPGVYPWGTVETVVATSQSAASGLNNPDLIYEVWRTEQSGNPITDPTARPDRSGPTANYPNMPSFPDRP